MNTGPVRKTARGLEHFLGAVSMLILSHFLNLSIEVPPGGLVPIVNDLIVISATNVIHNQPVLLNVTTFGRPVVKTLRGLSDGIESDSCVMVSGGDEHAFTFHLKKKHRLAALWIHTEGKDADSFVCPKVNETIRRFISSGTEPFQDLQLGQMAVPDLESSHESIHRVTGPRLPRRQPIHRRR